MTFTAAERTAMSRALELAAASAVPLHPNPRVGCVLLDRDGRQVAEGRHRGAGTPHAEAEALGRAGADARGATAVVTLEPCDHTGRTGPCSEALIAAGVRRVVYAQADPNPVAAGGASRLRDAGLEVEGGLYADEASTLNRVWSVAVSRGRPYVTWKLATTLDGRSAAADGTSRWISSTAARLDAQRLRAEVDTMMVGTNTVEVDDPLLTARDEHGKPAARQPLRVVVGLRDLPATRRVFDADAETLHLRSRDPRDVLDALHERERRHVLLEGGPTLAAAFLRAGCVDEIVAYVTPSFLGAGSASVADLGITTIAGALRPVVTSIDILEPAAPGEQPNVRIAMQPKES